MKNRLTPCRERICRKWAKEDYSVYSWARSFDMFPSLESKVDASMSERWRLFVQGAVTVNGRKVRPWDVMPLEVNELVFFKGSKRQTTIR